MVSHIDTELARRRQLPPVAVPAQLTRGWPPLVARASELELGRRLLAAARAGSGKLLMLEGPAGIGKTRVLDAVIAGADGFTLLRAAGSPLEQRSAFWLARDLLGTQLAPITDTLAGDPGSVSRHAGELTAELATTAPLVLAIDDLQWADEGSLRWLVNVCARLPELPILVLLAWRSGLPRSTQLAELFHSFGGRLELSMLPASAVGELRAAAETGALADVAAEVGRRLGDLGPQAIALAQATAVLGDSARLRIAAALAGVELERAAQLADELVGRGLLATASPPAFPDLVIRGAVYEAIAGGHRSLLHGRAARALAGDGAPDHEVAAHLLRSEPAGDAAAVGLLRGLAVQAHDRNQPGRAVQLLRRALAEPPAARERPAILLELGLLEARCGLREARAHLHQASRHGDAGVRGQAAIALADLELLAGRHRDAIAVLEPELAGHPPGDEDIARALRAELGTALMLAAKRARGGTAADADGASGAGADGASDAGADGAEAPGRRALLALAAADAALAGEPIERTRTLLQHSSLLEPGLAGRELPAAASLLSLWVLQTAEEPPLLERAVETKLRAARIAGSEAGESLALALRGRIRLARGRLIDAELDARRSLELSRALGLALPATLALSLLVDALVDQGRLIDAERELSLDGAGERGADDLACCLLVSARGRLRAAAGEAHLGIRDLLAVGARLLRGGCLTPGIAWRSRAGLLAHRLDRRDEALRLIDDEYVLARRLGAPRPLGIALWAKAHIDPDSPIELFHASADELRRSQASLELARTLCDLGAALRHSNFRRSAREPLHEALQLAHECGAVALAERARRELIVLGARPRRYAVTGLEALTAREREASELAAGGLTNRQIAEVMSVTPNTVEYHLTNAFRKLGIGNREGLAVELVGARGVGASPSITRSR